MDITLKQSLSLLSHVVQQQAVTMAFADVFWLMAVLFVGMLVFLPLLKPNPSPTPAAAAETHNIPSMSTTIPIQAASGLLPKA